MRRLMLGAAATAMLATATVAQAAPAGRAASLVSESEAMGGGATVWLGLLGALMVGLVIWQINDEDDVDLPTSP